MLKPYKEYKRVDMQWIDRIPSHWQYKRNKNLMAEINERSLDGSEELLRVSQYTGITVRRLNEKKVGMHDAETLEGYKIVRKNDIVMNIMLAWNGSTGASSYDGIVSPAYSVFRTNQEINPWYIHYLFRIPVVTNYFKAYSTGVIESRLRLYPEKLFMLFSIIPPRKEQDQIVRFLNWKLSKVNKLIWAKKKQIALLNERKQAVIDNAVSKGIGKKTTLVMSGNRWVQQMPEGWNNIALKRVFAVPMSDGPHETPELLGEGIPFISAEGSHDGRIFLDECRGYISKEQHEIYCRKVKPQRNDIFIVKSGSTTGKVVIVDFDNEFSIWSPLALVRCNSDYSCWYVFYYLSSSFFQQAVHDSWSFGTQPNIGMNVLKDLPILRPPFEEQIEIANYIASKITNIDLLIKKEKKIIETISEYRTSLISDVVTGKVDVRAVGIPEDEVVFKESFEGESDDESDIDDEKGEVEVE